MKTNIQSFLLKYKNVLVWENPGRTSYILENFGHLYNVKPTGEFSFIEQILMPKCSLAVQERVWQGRSSQETQSLGLGMGVGMGSYHFGGLKSSYWFWNISSGPC